jgi:hypothetical protein
VGALRCLLKSCIQCRSLTHPHPLALPPLPLLSSPTFHISQQHGHVCCCNSHSESLLTPMSTWRLPAAHQTKDQQHPHLIGGQRQAPPSDYQDNSQGKPTKTSIILSPIIGTDLFLFNRSRRHRDERRGEADRPRSSRGSGDFVSSRS